MWLFGKRKTTIVPPQDVAPVMAKVEASFAELVAQKQSIDAEIKKRKQSEIAVLQSQASAIASALNVGVGELFGIETTERVRRKRREVKAKFKHPTEDLTWSGRGKPPKWILALIAEGRSKDEYLIEKA